MSLFKFMKKLTEVKQEDAHRSSFKRIGYKLNKKKIRI